MDLSKKKTIFLLWRIYLRIVIDNFLYPRMTPMIYYAYIYAMYDFQEKKIEIFSRKKIWSNELVNIILNKRFDFCLFN